MKILLHYPPPRLTLFKIISRSKFTNYPAKSRKNRVTK